MVKYPYTCVSNPKLLEVAQKKYEPLIKVGLRSASNLWRVEAYIDTGAQWCLFNCDIAKYLGIKDYKDTKERVYLSGVGGKQPENIAYFHNLDLLIFKDTKHFVVENAWIIENTKIGFLERTIGFAGILGVYGFLDHFVFKTCVPEGYFEIENFFE